MDYSLPGRIGDAELRLRRAPDRYGVLTRWRVIDPLLVPVVLQTTVPTFDTARLGDADLPATSMGDPHPRRVLMYPAVYELRGRASANLDFSGEATVATEVDASKPVTFFVKYQASPALRQLVLDKTIEYIKGCMAAGDSMAPNCPVILVERVGFARNLSLTGQPALESTNPRGRSGIAVRRGIRPALGRHGQRQPGRPRPE
ncbi:hypothetical protein ORV05_22830 [Amycolatopsis cynarae]|uniref:Uncharacterized protein n=1 Tax=Amycolatopsis cynarae TaxID=2995223 RepID=A0ABY7AVV1_9PSEU|nr:hypothetical protein [Amycolatopsis sp. HUAS 11-8]WAL63815.1 hypothetical protein ORV05_22830 [Amycolatopsis sp. HUAS 11-8]